MIDHVILTVSDFKRSVAFYHGATFGIAMTEVVDKFCGDSESP
jgi:catechol 2,3-dioxygenase-like lactoylglutathione lyase family enzyme